MRHQNAGAGAARVMPTAEHIAEAELQIDGLRAQAARAGEMITGLALIRDGVDCYTTLENSLDAIRNLQEGLHILLTAWGAKLQAEEQYLERLAGAHESNLELARSGLVIPQ